MNYRHAFHAGNHADVLKHIILALVLAKLNEKEKPYRVLDVHAGVGLYDLRGVEAVRTGEWQSGIGKMVEPFSAEVEGVLAPYRAALHGVQSALGAHVYPGSPAIALQLMRVQDKMICNDLHPGEVELLHNAVGGDQRVRITQRDAVHAVKAELPFDQRRGLVLIDPPYEDKRETEFVMRALREGVKRFANGVFLVWYPVKGEAFADELVAAVAGLGVPNIVRCELRIRESFEGGGLAGSGVLIVNPPYQLRGKLELLLPALAERLGVGTWGRGSVSDLTLPIAIAGPAGD
jgi:23S rRNA (adenine2030-N6)-methyltransferase